MERGLIMQNKGEIMLYQTKDGKTNLDVKFEKETVWLTQKQIATLFKKGIPAINEHIKNIFKEGELDEGSVIRKFRITAKDGKSYDTNFYNLDVIISVGYRVRSKEGTQFRIWATNVLRDFIVKGYAANLKRLEELENRFEIHRENYRQFHYLISKLIINTPRRDVMNAVIDDMEKFKEEFKSFVAKFDKLR